MKKVCVVPVKYFPISLFLPTLSSLPEKGAFVRAANELIPVIPFIVSLFPDSENIPPELMPVDFYTVIRGAYNNLIYPSGDVAVGLNNKPCQDFTPNELAEASIENVAQEMASYFFKDVFPNLAAITSAQGEDAFFQILRRSTCKLSGVLLDDRKPEMHLAVLTTIIVHDSYYETAGVITDKTPHMELGILKNYQSINLIKSSLLLKAVLNSLPMVKAVEKFNG